MKIFPKYVQAYFLLLFQVRFAEGERAEGREGRLRHQCHPQQPSVAGGGLALAQARLQQQNIFF